MGKENLSLIISIVAVSISVATFFINSLWRTWRDRPRLSISCKKVEIVSESDDRRFPMVRIGISNIGYRSIILTGCAFIGEKGSYFPGAYDQPAVAYGIHDRKFPVSLDPGQTLDIHPISIGALERNWTDPDDTKALFNPYLYFVVIDSFKRYHSERVRDMRWALHMEKSRKPDSFWMKLKGFYERRRILAAYRKRESNY